MNEEAITFVVQGPVCTKNGRNLTLESLNSIRACFPRSTIVFSTDTGMSIDDLPFDILVETQTEDLRVIENDRVGNIMPANLQIATTIAGLRAVKTEYAIKIRSDMFLENRNLLRLIGNRPKRVKTPGLTLTDELVLVLNWSTVDPRRYLKLAHHPSDLLYAGKTSDLLAIWDVPRYPVEFMRWFENVPYPVGAQHGGSLVRYRCEAWIWMNFAKSAIQYPLDTSYDFSQEILDESIRLMVHNLEVVSAHMCGVKSLKNEAPSIHSRMKMLTYLDWIRLARKHGVHARFTRLDLDSFRILACRVIVDLFNWSDFVFPKYSQLKKKESGGEHT